MTMQPLESKPARAFNTYATTNRKPQLDQLLQASSRTFALTIPVLPTPLQGQVGLAYLLLRAADGIEDATQVELDRRLHLLTLFEAALETRIHQAHFLASLSGFADQLPKGGERDVVAASALLFDELESLPERPQTILRQHCARVARRMRACLTTNEDRGGQRLTDLGELNDYMYSVAGIVGELLTDLFVLHLPDAPALRLMGRSADFGAGLQLTNIIRDAAEDARMNRYFLPSEWRYVNHSDGEAPLLALIEMAQMRLNIAIDYTCLLPSHAPQVRLFASCPLCSRSPHEALLAGKRKPSPANGLALVEPV